jgi:hypothetical protein
MITAIATAICRMHTNDVTNTGNTPPVAGGGSPGAAGTGSASPPDRSGGLKVAGLLVSIAAVVVAVISIQSERRVAAGLLVFAGVVLIVLLTLGHVSRSRRFSMTVAGILTAILIGAGSYLYVVPMAKATAKPPVAHAPRLTFTLQSPATVPWCRAYTVSASGPLPAGYQMLMFDSQAGPQGNPTGFFTFDGAAAAVPRAGGEWTVQDVFIGDKYRKDENGNYLIRNGKHVSEAGFKGVITVVLMANRYAKILQHVFGQPRLSSLPPVLTGAQLEVTRRVGHVALCPNLRK